MRLRLEPIPEPQRVAAHGAVHGEGVGVGVPRLGDGLDAHDVVARGDSPRGRVRKGRGGVRVVGPQDGGRAAGDPLAVALDGGREGDAELHVALRRRPHLEGVAAADADWVGVLPPRAGDDGRGERGEGARRHPGEIAVGEGGGAGRRIRDRADARAQDAGDDGDVVLGVVSVSVLAAAPLVNPDGGCTCVRAWAMNKIPGEGEVSARLL